MQWDLGIEGLALLGAMALGFGVVAALLVGDGWPRRLWAVVVDGVACFGVGLLTSELIFGWATEEDLQPNVDGLSRDEVLLSGVLTTGVVVIAMRYVSRRAHDPDAGSARHLVGRHPVGRHRALHP